MQCVLQGKESELGLVSQEVLTRESRSQCPHCPHGTHRTPRTPQGELRVSLCSTRSLLSTQNTQGCSQILGVAVWRATGRWWQGSISSFLSSVSLFSMCGVGRSPRREGSHLPQLHRQFAAGFSKGIYVELMVFFVFFFLLMHENILNKKDLMVDVLLQRIPAMSGLTLRMGCWFLFLLMAIGLLFQNNPSHCLRVLRMKQSCSGVMLGAVPSTGSFKVQPVLTGKVRRHLSDATASCVPKITSSQSQRY